jgi:hypothetical protein
MDKRQRAVLIAFAVTLLLVLPLVSYLMALMVGAG